MPRTARASVGNSCYHCLNRGNAHAPLFHKSEDYEAFVELIGDACARLPMRVLAFCLMPNHFHLVLRPHADNGDLSRWMPWLLTSHVRRYHRHFHGSGHVWQGRFKAFPIQQGQHLRTALRYVEPNPLRVQLVERAELWARSSLKWWTDPRPLPFLDCRTVKRGSDWVHVVNAPMCSSRRWNESGTRSRAIRRSVGIVGYVERHRRWGSRRALTHGADRGRPRRK